ncbi:uncharacterized protein F4807DRAFT_430593 [Annulohypoxylon truncatum]|uniref:uncharacterized protein n=1 Tax=Annulohypoxylon truncatum TaxID=327061 RepID=UPI00200860D4|nr:uncharacterized protein F4807DRAFT_430593 [Annulohypoxylon truncatum]KAI1208664.1 hypothetical protein F4807DRAFT_430593 [Annulohypoxylon truncatum]
MSPSHRTPLLESADNASYDTVKPKAKPTTAAPLEQPSSESSINEDYVVDIERITTYSSTSSLSWAYSYEDDHDIYFCDYCAQNNLQHSREWDPGDLWRKCMESEGSLAVLEFIIAFQMRLLTVLVPLFLLFTLRIYMIGYIDDRYVSQPQYSILPEGSTYSYT